MGIVASAKVKLGEAKGRIPVVAHALRMWKWGGSVGYGRLGAAITYYGFLSLFPLLALGFAALGYATRVSPHLQDSFVSTISENFPGLVQTKAQAAAAARQHKAATGIDLGTIQNVAGSTGIIGLVALLWTGTGFVDALRDALSVVFATQRHKPSFLKKKLGDVANLLLLGGFILVSSAVSVIATAATGAILRAVGQGGSTVGAVLLRILAIGLSLLLDAGVLGLLMNQLSGRELSWRQLRYGALIGAAGIEILKVLAGFLLKGTTHNAIYGIFAVVIGALLWINYTARVFVLSACWVATERTVAADRTAAAVSVPATVQQLRLPGLRRARAAAAPRFGSPAAVAGVVAAVLLTLKGRSGGDG